MRLTRPRREAVRKVELGRDVAVAKAANRRRVHRLAGIIPGSLSGNVEGAPVKPSNVLTLTGDSASLSVKRGALIAAQDTTSLVYEPRAVKPRAIVMTGWGGFVTLAALRFCAKHKIAVVILDWDRDFMTAMALPARRAARVARAQLAAMSPASALLIAKALIAAKIEAHARVGAIDEVEGSSCYRASAGGRHGALPS